PDRIFSRDLGCDHGHRRRRAGEASRRAQGAGPARRTALAPGLIAINPLRPPRGVRSPMTVVLPPITVVLLRSTTPDGAAYGDARRTGIRNQTCRSNSRSGDADHRMHVLSLSAGAV